MATVICFETEEYWKYIGTDERYKVNFSVCLGAVIAKGNIIDGCKAKY